MSELFNAKSELDEIFIEYKSDINRGKYKRYAKVIAVLMEYDNPWSYRKFLWKKDENRRWWVGTGVWLQFNDKILSVHKDDDKKEVMNYFHSIDLDYKPRSIRCVAEQYRALAERKIENIHSYKWIIAAESLRTRLYNLLKAAKINSLIDVLWYGSDPTIDIPKIRNLWSKNYALLMEIVRVFLPENSYTISTWEIELFKKILWLNN